MGTNDPEDPPELPPTALAGLVAQATQKLARKPDRHGPAAVQAMAAIVRDLKGMPDLALTREGGTRLRIGRRGKVGFVVIAYDAAVTVLEVSIGGFSEFAGHVGAPAAVRYTLQGDVWQRMDGGGALFTDLREHMLRLYPEIA